MAVIKLDKEDFYMRGDPARLASDASRHIVDDDAREATAQLCQFLLENQYVDLAKRGGCFKVVTGSDVGKIMSGDLSGLHFYWLCEEPHAAVHVVQQTFGIRAYLRYRDDILIVAELERLAAARWYTDRLKELARPSYEVTDDGVYIDEACLWLDIQISHPCRPGHHTIRETNGPDT